VLLGSLSLLAATLQAEELTESPVPDAYVARAIFTTGISNREPVDQVVSVGPDQESIYFFSDLRNLQGRTVRHRWEFEGQYMGEIEFDVSGPRWRVFSKKSLDPASSGKWTVLVLDESGWPLHASIFMQGEHMDDMNGTEMETPRYHQDDAAAVAPSVVRP
jgi:hypothetical protein